MFIELIDTSGQKRYVNKDHIQEIVPKKGDNGETIWKVVFCCGCSWFTSYNIEKLIGEEGV